MNEKIYFISLGCDKNRVDAEMLCHRLVSAGFSITPELEEADAALINTCGFIESAKAEAIENIFDMVREKEAGNIRAIVVTGCLSERNGEEMMELIPEVDAVVGIGQNADIAAIFRRALDGESHAFSRCPLNLPLEGERLLSTPQHYAFLKIAEGCDNHCTYCAIPAIRGRYRSREEAAILAEAKQLVSYGVRELIVIAQDTTSYGKDLKGGETLTRLLQKLTAIEGLWKVRVLYAYPEHITEELTSEFANNDKLCKYLDLPLQHAHPAVLKRMGRFGSAEENLALLRKLREKVPGMTLRSTFIAGFPGETEQQFEALLQFLDDAQLDRAGCFAYSAEEGTPAGRLPEQLEEAEKLARTERFYEHQMDITYERQSARLGSEFEAICDGFDEERMMFLCRSEADVPEEDCYALVPLAADLMPGEVYQLRAVEMDGLDLICELCETD